MRPLKRAAGAVFLDIEKIIADCAQKAFVCKLPVRRGGRFEHDREKLAGFSDKITRPNKKIESALDSI